MTAVNEPRVSLERKPVRNLRWSLRLRRATFWMVCAIGLLAPVSLAPLLSSQHNAPRLWHAGARRPRAHRVALSGHSSSWQPRLGQALIKHKKDTPRNAHDKAL